MDSISSGSDSPSPRVWVSWFLGLKGNEFFCDIDEEYIVDRFNLTGLNAEVQHFAQAFDLIQDQLDQSLSADTRSQVEASARHLYGLIHARFILTNRGITKMLEKYRMLAFGSCPRHLCDGNALLPVGLSDAPGHQAVKLYCPSCQDVYNPRSSRYHSCDGAYFGSTFPHMFFQVQCNLTLASERKLKRYVPKIFGFKVYQYRTLLGPPKVAE